METSEGIISADMTFTEAIKNPITFVPVSKDGKVHAVIERTRRRTLCGMAADAMMPAGKAEAHLTRTVTADTLDAVRGCMKCREILADDERLARIAFARLLDKATGRKAE